MLEAVLTFCHVDPWAHTQVGRSASLLYPLSHLSGFEFEVGSHVAKAGLKLVILLPVLPQCWDYRFGRPCQALDYGPGCELQHFAAQKEDMAAPFFSIDEVGLLSGPEEEIEVQQIRETCARTVCLLSAFTSGPGPCAWHFPHEQS